MTAAAPRPSRRLRVLVLGGALAALLGVGLLPGVRAFLAQGYAALTSSDPAVTQAFVESLGWGGLSP